MTEKEYEISREDRLDLLRETVELLTEHPPKYKRGRNSSFSGELDCDVCGYPLTGSVRPDMVPHDQYVSPTRGKCKYMEILGKLKAWIKDCET
jgi:hypothetical protein